MSSSFIPQTVGHGKSEGYRVHVDTYETYTTDVIQHVEWMRGQYPDLPSFLMGHSMVSVMVQYRSSYSLPLSS